VRFHRAGYVENRYGISLDKTARAWIKSARMLTDSMNFFVCEPDNSLLSNRSDNEAFCLAEVGEQYAVYFTDSGSVTLDMTEAPGNFDMKWLEIPKAEWWSATVINGGGHLELNAPGNGQWLF
jgi:hypothetical protein